MKTKILAIGVIRKDKAILMRKKPDGSPPYKETWYVFGAEPQDEQSPEETLTQWIEDNLGITVQLKEHLGWDTEVKADHDGETKRFIYLDVLYEFVDGELQIPNGVEKVEWVAVDNLKDYDIVPPSVTLFKKLGYM